MTYLIMALFLVFGTDASAASMKGNVDLVTLTQRSESVVRGVITDAETIRTEYGLRTFYTLTVEETLRGMPRYTVEVVLPGGVLDGLIESVAGVPQWDLGDDVIVFVPHRGPIGLRGVFTVDRDRLSDPMGGRGILFPNTITELMTDMHDLAMEFD